MRPLLLEGIFLLTDQLIWPRQYTKNVTGTGDIVCRAAFNLGQ